MNIYSIYSPPRYTVTCLQYEDFFRNIGQKFIVGGDFNAKHPWWGSRLTNPKGRELYKCILKHHYSSLSTGSPTYWPSDLAKTPDLLDFIIYNGIPRSFLDILDSADLSSDHSPLIATLSIALHTVANLVKVVTHKTDLQYFGYWIDQNLNLNTSIKSGSELEDTVETFTKLIHEAAYLSTPKKFENNGNNVRISAEIRELISEKRRLRRLYQSTRSSLDKTNFNRASQYLKKRLREYKNELVKNFLKNLDIARNDEYSLWKATRYLKRPTKRNVPIKDDNGDWCRYDSSKANTFKTHLEKTFNPFELNNTADRQQIENFLDIACQMDLPIKHITPEEVKSTVNKLNNTKSPGYDNIDVKVVKFLPRKGIIFLTTIFNSILRLNISHHNGNMRKLL